MVKLIVLVFTALIISSCEKGPHLGPPDEVHLASAAETDCGFVQNAYGQRVSWNKNIPVTIQFHPNFPSEFEETVKKAANHWNEAAGLTLFRFIRSENNGAESATVKDSVNTIRWELTWPESQKGLQAITHLYWRDDQLYESDILINVHYYNFFIDQPTTPSDLHLESILIHELGHALGLKHRNTVPSVMWAVLNGAVKRDVLTAADRETIKCEY